MSYLFVIKCNGCHSSFLFNPNNEDPTSSLGCCCVCGSSSYSIHKTDVTEKDIFVAALADQYIVYNILERNVM